jgi:hypothetical protein
MFLINNPFCASSTAATKSILEKVGGFPLGVKYGGDVDTWIRLSVATKIAFFNKPLAIVHLEAENRITRLQHDPSEEFHQIKTVRQLVESGAVPEQLRQSAFEYSVKVQLRLARIFLAFGNNKGAKMLIQSSKGTKRFNSKWLLLSLWASIPAVLYLPFLEFRRELRQKKK